MVKLEVGKTYVDNRGYKVTIVGQKIDGYMIGEWHTNNAIRTWPQDGSCPFHPLRESPVTYRRDVVWVTSPVLIAEGRAPHITYTNVGVKLEQHWTGWVEVHRQTIEYTETPQAYAKNLTS